jgi:polysaccharide export outer membrane protein
MGWTVPLGFALLVSASGCGATAPQPNSAEAQLQVPGELALGPGDTFDVRVFGESDLSATYRLGDDGTIDYPLIGQIRLEGMEPHEAGQLIATKLGERFLKHPQVSILVKEQPSKRVTVIGQVAKPGWFSFEPNMSVVQAITLAGGFTPIAAKNKTTITRIAQGQKVAIEVPVADIGEGKARNVLVRPGDIISVPERIF